MHSVRNSSFAAITNVRLQENLYALFSVRVHDDLGIYLYALLS